jgi:flagellar FliL protein
MASEKTAEKGAERTEESQETEQKKPSSAKKLIILAALVLVMGGGAAVGWFKFFKKQPEPEAKQEVAESVMQDMETFLVNLSDPGGKRYLKLQMKAKLSSKQVAAEFVSHNFEIRDRILTLLSSKEFNEISSPEDKATLKQEVIQRVNKLLQQGQVQDIYFTEFLVQ